MHHADISFCGAKLCSQPSRSFGGGGDLVHGQWGRRVLGHRGFLLHSSISFTRLCLFYPFLIHLLRMGEQLSDGLTETVLPWEFHDSWELWGSLKRCSISPLAVLCPSDSTATGWPGAEETQTQHPAVFQEVLRTGMMSRGTIAGRARLKAPAYTDQFPLSLPGVLGQVHVSEQSQSRSALPEQPGTLPCVLGIPQPL